MLIRNRLMAAAACLAAFASVPAYATNDNLGFENGDVSGWTSNIGALTGAVNSSLGDTSRPAEGSWYGYALGGNDGDYTTLSQLIHLDAGQTASWKWGFLARDTYDADAGLNDDGYVSFDGLIYGQTNVLQMQLLGYPDQSFTGWSDYSFTSVNGGDYLLQIGSRNVGDSDPIYSSYALLDAVTVADADAPADVPEPASWMMMLVGFGMLGTAMRRRRVAVAA